MNNDSFEEQKMEGLLREAVPSSGDASQNSNGQLMFEMGRVVGMKCSGNRVLRIPQSLRIWQGATAASVMAASLLAVLLLQQWPGERTENVAANSSSEKSIPANTLEISADNVIGSPFEMTNAEVDLASESTGGNTRWLRSPADRHDRLLAAAAGETLFDSIVETSSISREQRIDIRNRMLGPYQSVRKLLESEEL